MKLITENPYRILGVYANSSKKERVANQGKIKAFLKVGKSIEFPLDLGDYLGPIQRTDLVVSAAEAKLSLVNEQMLYAQFWFLKQTPLDEIAFNKLISGDKAGALNIWRKKSTLSSLQNRLICALFDRRLADAMQIADELYSTYSDDFINTIQGENKTIKIDDLAFAFLDALQDEFELHRLLPRVKNEQWRAHLSAASLNPLTSQLLSAVSEAQAENRSDAEKQYLAGYKLMKLAQELLPKLCQILSEDDIQYQILVDKVGLAILQCGINYYNNTEEFNSPRKALVLQQFALDTVIGTIAKQRCEENMRILRKAVDALPPIGCENLHAAIEASLRKFNKLPSKVSYSLDLLNETISLLGQIKDKQGGTMYYLNLSTKVGKSALYNIIEEVNDSQKLPFSEDDEFEMLMFKYDEDKRNQYINRVRRCLESVCPVIVLLDKLDKTEEFQIFYTQNRKTVVKLCSQFNVNFSVGSSRPSSSVGSSRPSSSSSSSRPSSSGSSSRPSSSGSSSYSSSSSSSNYSSSSNDFPIGCWILIILAVIIGLISNLS